MSPSKGCPAQARFLSQHEGVPNHGDGGTKKTSPKREEGLSRQVGEEEPPRTQEKGLERTPVSERPLKCEERSLPKKQRHLSLTGGLEGDDRERGGTEPFAFTNQSRSGIFKKGQSCRRKEDSPPSPGGGILCTEARQKKKNKESSKSSHPLGGGLLFRKTAI